jgi:glycosyltransferase involved in cell wall biosynthesis
MYPNLTLTMTGQTNSPHEWINARGWVSEEEKNTLLCSTSVLLVPSAFEGQPMVVLEAISAGLPVCVSDRVIGLPDTVRTAAYNDIDAWVETISAIFADAPSHETLIASAAPYRIEDVRKRWKHIYESF